MSWVLASFLVLGLALAAGFAWYERSHPSARVLALVATLAALAALGRIAFAPLPNVKPTTDIVLLTGYVLGGAPGFAVGAVAALASNLFFGQGPWTPWQMAGWGASACSARCWRASPGASWAASPLAAACARGEPRVRRGDEPVAVGHLLGRPHARQALVLFATSLPFDVAHAIGSVLFCLAFGPALVRALRRFRTRFEVTWRPAPAAARSWRPCSRRRRRRAAARRRRRAARGRCATSSARRTPTAASGRRPAPARRRCTRPGRRSGSRRRGATRATSSAAARASSTTCARTPAELRGDLGERSRTILALRAAGLPAGTAGRPRPARRAAARAGARRLVRRPRQHDRVRDPRAARGGPRVTGDPAVRRAARRSSPARPTPTAASTSRPRRPVGRRRHRRGAAGARRGGRRGSRAVRRAVRWLARRQNADGGFSLQGGPSNAQSTAWAVQGLVAAGRGPGERAARRARGRRSPTCARWSGRTARSATRARAPRRPCG